MFAEDTGYYYLAEDIELDRALEVAFKTDGPYLVECIIDKDELVLPMLPPGGSMDDIIVKVGD